MKNPPRIFDYTEYRKFLSDLFAWEKAHRPRFSLRTFGAKISTGLATSSFLSAVLKGKKNIGPSLRVQFIQALGLNVREGKYFDLLVRLNQAKGLREKGFLFAQLSRFNHSRAKIVYESQFRLFTKWYYPVIWNYFGIKQKVGNLSEIANTIRPALTMTQVQEAVKLLLELGVIKKLANGYAVTEKHFTTEPEFRGLEAIPYTEMFLDLAAKALQDISPEHRKFGTLVFTASTGTVEKIRDKLATLNEEIQELIDRDDKPEGIHTLCFQLFPNTLQR